MENKYVEIKVDTRIKTVIKIQKERPNIFVYDKKANIITLIKIGITSIDNLQV